MVFGVSGLAFMAANLWFARLLQPADYGRLALFVAITNFMIKFGPLGADVGVVREPGCYRPAMLRQVALTSLGCAIGVALVAQLVYGLGPGDGLLLVVAGVAGGVTGFVAAAFQGRGQYLPSLAYLHSSNFLLLLAAACVAVFGSTSASAAFLLFVCLTSTVAVSAVRVVRVGVQPATGDAPTLRWGTSLLLVAVAASSDMLTQLDRFTTPYVLDFADLGRLGVLLALVGPPFRLLEMTAGYAMLPAFRSAADARERRRLMVHELGNAFAIVVPAALLLILVVPWLAHSLAGGAYAVERPVVVAAVIAGSVKVAHGFANALATAVVVSDRLALMAGIGVLAVVVGAVAALAGGRAFALEGLLYGVALGWLFRLVCLAILVRRDLRSAPADA